MVIARNEMTKQSKKQISLHQNIDRRVAIAPRDDNLVSLRAMGDRHCNLSLRATEESEAIPTVIASDGPKPSSGEQFSVDIQITPNVKTSDVLTLGVSVVLGAAARPSACRCVVSRIKPR